MYFYAATVCVNIGVPGPGAWLLFFIALVSEDTRRLKEEKNAVVRISLLWQPGVVGCYGYR